MSTMVCFDKLPIHKILDYLESYDIFTSLYNINTYINMIIDTYDRFRLNFQSISMSNFNRTVYYINPYQVISLTLSNMNNTPGQFQLFLSLFSLKQFLHLKSLQLIQPTNTIELNKILIDLSAINSLKSLSIIHCQRSSINQQTFLILSSYLNTSTSLNRLYLSGTLNSLFEYNFISKIDHLYFNDNIFNTVTLQTIINRMPYLKSLDTAITLNINSINFLYLTRLTITIFINLNNLNLKILLNQMLSLVFFKIIANGKQWFNGHFWEECLPINLQIFQFNFCTQSIYINEQIIFETFQTSFWMNKKHWYVMLDYQMNPTMMHLYSLPYCDTQFYYRPTMNPNRKFRSLIKSNMNNVTKLTVDLSTLITESNSSLSSIHFFSNISTLILTDTGCHSSVESLFDFLKSIIDLNRIVELKLGQFHHPNLIKILYNHMPKLNSLRITETILMKLEKLDFRNIYSLTICDCLTNIDRICLMFPFIKYLCVKLISFEHMRQVMKLLEKSLINITFRQINQDLKQSMIKWLYEYCGEHRQFSYDIDEHMNLHIWLSDILI